MARYVGKIIFPDKDEKYFIWNGTCSSAYRRLFDTPQQVWDHYCKEGTSDPDIRPSPEESCEVELYREYEDSELAFMTRASKSKMIITGPVNWLEWQTELDREQMGGLC